MNRLPLWLHITLAAAVFAFGMLGVTNSVHLAAKIIYALLIAASAVALTRAFDRARA